MGCFERMTLREGYEMLRNMWAVLSTWPCVKATKCLGSMNLADEFEFKSRHKYGPSLWDKFNNDFELEPISNGPTKPIQTDPVQTTTRSHVRACVVHGLVPMHLYWRTWTYSYLYTRNFPCVISMWDKRKKLYLVFFTY